MNLVIFIKRVSLFVNMIEELVTEEVQSDDDFLEFALLKWLDDSEILAKSGETRTQKETLAVAERYKIDPEYYMFTAKLGDEAVGYWIGHDNVAEFVSDGIFVKQEFRGRGLGKKIKERQIQFTRERGFDTITSRVAKSNVASIRVNEALGFESEDCGDHYLLTLYLK